MFIRSKTEQCCSYWALQNEKDPPLTFHVLTKQHDGPSYHAELQAVTGVVGASAASGRGNTLRRGDLGGDTLRSHAGYLATGLKGHGSTRTGQP